MCRGRHRNGKGEKTGYAGVVLPEEEEITAENRVFLQIRNKISSAESGAVIFDKCYKAQVFAAEYTEKNEYAAGAVVKCVCDYGSFAH